MKCVLGEEIDIIIVVGPCLSFAFCDDIRV